LEGEGLVLEGIGVRAVTDHTAVFIAGDSTVCDQDPQLNAPPESRYTGWGQLIPQFFKRGISVVNYADSGESTAAFRTDGGSLWNAISSRWKSGDYLLIQLGHNDKTTGDALYRSRVTSMVTTAMAAGIHPVLISPMVRNTGAPLEDQHKYDGNLDVRAALMQISIDENVPFIDLMKMSADWVIAVGGQSAAQAYYTDSDKTHSNELGAKIFAGFVVDGVIAEVPDLASHLR
jgi:lysophospholipase L1-like esterase